MCILYTILPTYMYTCVIGVATTDVLIVSLIAIDLEGAVLSGCEAAVVTSPAPSRRAVLRLRPVKYQACSVRVQVEHTICMCVYVIMYVMCNDLMYILYMLW